MRLNLNCINRIINFLHGNLVWFLVLLVYAFLLKNSFSATASNYVFFGLEMLLFIIFLNQIRGGKGHIFRIIFSMLLVVVYVVQGFALYLSESYIGSLALENVNQGESVVTSNALIMAVAIVSLLIIYQIKIYFKKPFRDGVIKLNRRYFAVIFLIYCIFSFKYVGSGNQGSLQKYDTPLLGMMKSIYNFAKGYNISCISPLLVRDAGIHNKKVYEVEVGKKVKISTTPNVIVLFIEGMSKRNIDSNTYLDLMPNLKKFSNENLSLENYYNHTAATFRGLLGQLTSTYIELDGHSTHGWANNKLTANKLAEQKKHSVVDLMKAQGYQALFLEPHENSYPLSLALKTLSFDRVITLDDARSNLGPNVCITSSGISDRDQFRELQYTIENIKKDVPFFIGMYNNGTHAFIDVNECGVKYRAGNNPALNRYHNFDLEFGRFLDYFNKSGLHKNTILIVTTDHASWPEPPYKDAFQAEFGDMYFVSEIPFYVYSPIHELPRKLDMAGANSLSFAPTLSALLGLKNFENKFWGKSIFDDTKKNAVYVTSLGSEFYLTTKNGVVPEKNVSEEYRDEFYLMTQRIFEKFKADRVCGVKY